MENRNDDEMEIDLLKLARALWRRAWAIMLAAVIFGGAALTYTAIFVTPLYKAEALMYVNSSNISVGGAKVSISQGELTAAQSLIKTYAVILTTRTTLNDVIEQSGVSYTYEELKEMISAQSVNSTEVFSITVTSPSPREAELLANTIARILPEKISAIVEGSSARIVDYAVEPAKKASPSLSKNALIGAMLGFVLACGIVVIMELTDEQIHDSDYLIQTYDIPVLAVIPDLLSATSTNDYYQSAEQRMKKTR
ncbi:MAG: YveK family protein [Faecousia sp.]